MKHRHLTRSTSWKAGYTAPQPPKRNKGGKFPGNQKFFFFKHKEKSK